MTSFAPCPSPHRNPAGRRGAAAVEFAMTAPILFVLVLGAIEFSRANMLLHTTAIAATEAARSSIIAGATVNDCRLKALEELRVVGVVDAVVEMNPPEIVDDTPQVTVNLRVPVSMRNGYGLSRMFLGKHVFKSVTLQREGKFVDASEETVQREGMQNDKNAEEKREESNKGKGKGKGDDDDDDDD